MADAARLKILVAKAREFIRSEFSKVRTRRELAAAVFSTFDELWDLLTPSLQATWVWEQLRSIKDPDTQLPLVGIFSPGGGDISGPDAQIKPIEEWSRANFLKEWRHINHNIAVYLRKRVALEAKFAATFPGEQLELWAESE
jgi:hypothetical protein